MKHTLHCDRCGQYHEVEIDLSKLTKDQLKGREPALDFMCPDVVLMYRALSFNLDTRVTIFKSTTLKEEQNRLSDQLKDEWGAFDFENKLRRYIDLDLAFLGIPEEYYDLLWPVISAYCCGLFYPAMTSAGSLGERILNRLILKTRTHFKSSKHYKKIWNKDSFEQWDSILKILKDWQIISDTVEDLFLELKNYRNDSIHYNDGYDFDTNSHKAVKALAKIIDLQFNYTQRKDLFWVFDVPGEIWLRSKMVNDPFVKEFIIPHCALLSPFCEPLANPPIKGTNTPLKPLSDEEFIEIRKSRGK